MRTPADFLDQPDYVPITRTRLAESLRELGVRSGGVLMVHVRLSALGWMVGGIDAVVWALRDSVGPSGTLLAFTGWDDSPYHVSSWPERWQDAYRDQPPFDPATSAARRHFGRFPERLRTWPGARRSSHPEVSFAAWGPAAAELLADPADGDPWGPDGPLGRLVASEGQVLMLGAPLQRLTLCHHAEAAAAVEGKRYHAYRMPVLRDGRTDGSTTGPWTPSMARSRTGTAPNWRSTPRPGSSLSRPSPPERPSPARSTSARWSWSTLRRPSPRRGPGSKPTSRAPAPSRLDIDSATDLPLRSGTQ